MNEITKDQEIQLIKHQTENIRDLMISYPQCEYPEDDGKAFIVTRGANGYRNSKCPKRTIVKLMNQYLTHEEYTALIHRYYISSLLKMLAAVTKKDTQHLREVASKLTSSDINESDILVEAKRCLELDRQAYQLYKDANQLEQESA